MEHLLRLPSQNIISSIRSNAAVTSLFRLIFAEHNRSEKLTQFANHLHYNLIDSDASLRLILNQYLQKSNRMPVDQEKPCGRVEVIRKCNDVRINQALCDVSNLGENLAKLLLSDNFEPEKAGLLVDYLSAVELEIVNLKDDSKENVQVKKHYHLLSCFM